MAPPSQQRPLRSQLVSHVLQLIQDQAMLPFKTAPGSTTGFKLSVHQRLPPVVC
jgi:hypothetical protein